MSTRRAALAMLLTALLVVALALPAVAAAGDLDSTFSGDGKLRVGISGGASDVAIQGDGKAVAVGEAETSSPSCASTATGRSTTRQRRLRPQLSPSPPTRRAATWTTRSAVTARW